MSDRIKRILSHGCGPFWQFVKYGAIGVMATLVQVVVFYACAATFLECLKADDWMVRLAGLPAADVSESARAMNFALATGVGFCFSNLFCWLMNRWFVFRAGKFRWYVEFAMFSAAALLAIAIGTGVSAALIRWAGLMTTLAVLIEIVCSFLVNFFVRKFFIFRG